MLHTLPMPKINPFELEWKVATKTKAIFARPINSLINDIHFFSKLTLQTFEGPQAVLEGSMVCTGLSKTDPWQQSPKKLLAKYTVTDVTPDGWLYCEPKPDNKVNCHEVNIPGYVSQCGENAFFQIRAKWGKEVWPHGQHMPSEYIQTGEAGDYICQNQEDPNDVWIVKRPFFNSTYSIINDDTTKSL